MATDYRDDTALTDAQKSSLVGLATAVRTKMYGKDVREAIAAAIEMVGAPGVNSYFTPKGVKANLAALQTAYPTGTDGIWITQDDGYWNFWDGTSWEKGSAYQARGETPEVVDARTGYGNAAYPSLGEAIRRQIGSLVDATGFSVKNLLPNVFSSKSEYGVDWVANPDGTVELNGTGQYDTAETQTLTLDSGDYILSGTPMGGRAGAYYMMIQIEDGDTQFEYGNGLAFSLSSTSSVKVGIMLKKGIAASNLVFHPMIRIKGTYADDASYSKYNEFYVPSSLKDQIKKVKSPWSGKKMNAIGDSIILGTYGDFVSKIGSILGLSETRNYGVGGCRMASSDRDTDYPPVVNRFQNMDDDADIIMVLAGTNDYSGQVAIGDETSTDITTFNGALNVIMTGLRKKYPTALIVFLNIMRRYNDNSDSMAITTDAYREAIEKQCYNHNIVFYNTVKNLGFDFSTNDEDNYTNHYTTHDGLHPNENGAEIMARKISGFLSIM